MSATMIWEDVPGGRDVRRFSTSLVVCAAAVVCLAMASPAFAYDESTATVPSFNEQNCGRCHNPYPGAVFSAIGPHGAYASTSNKCGVCHDIHAAPSNGVKLLPGPTYTAMCSTCHDGTQGRGVYGAIAARGFTVTGNHSTEATSMIPGGNAATGGGATAVFSGVAATLTCIDCHNPHAANCVAPFVADRNRISSGGMHPNTNKLLRQRPTSAAATVTAYGSDWCAACHKGRLSGGALHNHPADSLAATSTPFTFNNVALLASDAPTSVTTLGALSMSNRGFLMPFPRTPQQTNHAPICQQCHADPRYVGDLVGAGTQGDAATYTVSIVNIDGTSASDNPRFTTFPHETTSTSMLIETNDDLCLNCHPALALP